MILARGGLVLLLSLLCILIPYAFPYHISIFLQGAPNVAPWFLVWALRSCQDPSHGQDLILFIVSLAIRWLSSGWPLPGSSSVIQLSWGVTTTFFCLIFAGYRFWHRSSPEVDISSFSEQHQVSAYPRIHPCRTTHSRMFPRRHSFSHSYLQVSIPVDFEGVWGLVSVGSNSIRSWFHVQASDYLKRGSSITNLKAKLSAFLESQGVNGSEWHHAYLVTAPRFLGYSFNPVSFWYIYNEDQVLTMMILEVNNTFDERRMYLLKTTEEEKSDKNAPTTPEKQVKNGRFKNAWPKDFHVSPFNSRKGYYTLSAVDLLTDGRVDNTIVLKSSKDHVKLVARIFSEGPSFDPKLMSTFDQATFLLRWFWVGFATFPRIIKQAALLFFQRKLHVWFRPEVLPSSIGRNPTAAEIELESFFVRYLEDVVKRCGTNIQVNYDSGLPDSGPRVFRAAGTGRPTLPADTLDIKILTPAFFSHFVHYAHTVEAFDRECIFTDEKNRTISVSKPALLPGLFGAGAGASQQPPGECFKNSWRWNLVKRLRCPPAKPSYPSPCQAGDGKDIRGMSLSPFDTFVLGCCDDAGLYQRHCIRMFLAERFAFGYPELIDFFDFIIRVGLIWLGVSAIVLSENSALSTGTWIGSLSGLARLSLVHFWAMLKG